MQERGRRRDCLSLGRRDACTTPSSGAEIAIRPAHRALTHRRQPFACRLECSLVDLQLSTRLLDAAHTRRAILEQLFESLQTEPSGVDIGLRGLTPRRASMLWSRSDEMSGASVISRVPRVTRAPGRVPASADRVPATGAVTVTHAAFGHGHFAAERAGRGGAVGVRRDGLDSETLHGLW